VRNAVPASVAKETVDDYEITPEFYYERDEKTGEIKTLERPFTVKDDEGVEVYSLMAPAVVVSLVKQLVKTLGL
jgi:hypothetical protein